MVACDPQGYISILAGRTRANRRIRTVNKPIAGGEGFGWGTTTEVLKKEYT
jgi:hypothetical protein